MHQATPAAEDSAPPHRAAPAAPPLGAADGELLRAIASLDRTVLKQAIDHAKQQTNDLPSVAGLKNAKTVLKELARREDEMAQLQKYARDPTVRSALSDLAIAARRPVVSRLRLAQHSPFLMAVIVVSLAAMVYDRATPSQRVELPADRRTWGAYMSCSRKHLRHVYDCPDGTLTRECLCDPPRADGTGCNETDSDMCNAGGMGPYWRFLHDLPSAERVTKTCLGGLLSGTQTHNRNPSTQERIACQRLLRRSWWPEVVQGIYLVGLLIFVFAGTDFLRRRSNDAVKRATVKIGVYDRQLKRFVDFGSGTLVSRKGHILTAAHVIAGHPEARTRNGKREMAWSDKSLRRTKELLSSEAKLLLAIGLYRSDGKPAVWRYWAKVLTTEETLHRWVENERPPEKPHRHLLDLAVLQILGPLQMEPEAFDGNDIKQEFELLGELEVAAPGALASLPAPLELDLSGRLVKIPSEISVSGWAVPSLNAATVGADSGNFIYRHLVMTQFPHMAGGRRLGQLHLQALRRHGPRLLQRVRAAQEQGLEPRRLFYI